MPSVLLIVFALNLVIHTINNVGASTFNDLVSLLTTSSMMSSSSRLVQKLTFSPAMGALLSHPERLLSC
jgi:hypothetical protein